MFIQTEATPNPDTLKFIPGEIVLESGTATFKAGESTAASPLAKRLLDVDGVLMVFFAHDFLSITKDAASDWAMLKPHILTNIMEHYVSGAPVMGDVAAATAKSFEDRSEEEQSLIKQIQELIESHVRPAVARDGGDIVFHDFKDGVVMLEMHGACSGCPSSTLTLKQGIEGMLKHYVPEVTSVEAV